MSKRLDIEWLEAWNALRAMVGPVKGSYGKGEHILPDGLIYWGRLLCGDHIDEYGIGIPLKDPSRHLASEMRDKEAAKRFINAAKVFLQLCERVIEEQKEKHRPPDKKRKAS